MAIGRSRGAKRGMPLSQVGTAGDLPRCDVAGLPILCWLCSSEIQLGTGKGLAANLCTTCAPHGGSMSVAQGARFDAALEARQPKA